LIGGMCIFLKMGLHAVSLWTRNQSCACMDT
jgi:hypothetical protein